MSQTRLIFLVGGDDLTIDLKNNPIGKNVYKKFIYKEVQVGLRLNILITGEMH